MACVLTSGISLPCRTTAGVSSTGVFVGSWQCSGSQMTIGLTANGSITSFTGATVSFYQICQDAEVASLAQTGTVTIENGTAFQEYTLIFNVFNVTQENQNTINTLMNGRWRVIVLGNDGNYYFLGYDNPVNVTTITGGINKAMGDLNGYSITMSFKSAVGIKTVTSGAFATIATYA